MAFAGTEEDTGHSNLGKREPNGTNKAHKLCCFFYTMTQLGLILDIEHMRKR